MGLLSSLAKLFKALIKAIVNFIKKYFMVILMVVLIVCAVYFAPAIAGWLSSVGAPSFLSSAFTWVGANVTPLLSAAWNGITSLGNSTYEAFSAASLGTKAAIVTGISAAIAPEETAAVIADAGTLVGDSVAALASGIMSSPVGWAVIGLAAWLFFGGSKNKEREST